MANEFRFHLKGSLYGREDSGHRRRCTRCEYLLWPANDARPAEAGTRVIKTPGGATIAHGLLRKLAGQKPDPRIEGGAFEAGEVVFGINEPANWLEGFHASELWEAVEVEAGKKKEKRWFPAKPPLGYGAAGIPTAAEYPATRMDEPTEEPPRIVVIDERDAGLPQAHGGRPVGRSFWPKGRSRRQEWSGLCSRWQAHWGMAICGICWLESGRSKLILLSMPPTCGALMCG